jgi:hypothetical protein
LDLSFGASALAKPPRDLPTELSEELTVEVEGDRHFRRWKENARHSPALMTIDAISDAIMNQ